MTQKLDELFGLPAGSEIENIRKALAEQNDKIEKEADAAEELSTELTPLAEKAMTQIDEREDRINQLIDLKDFDTDTEDLFKESMEAFRELMSVAKDVPAPSAGKIFEAAATFARVALDAKNSKVKARLDAIDLALKKKRIDLVEGKTDDAQPMDANSIFLDRNQLLAHIKDELGTENNKDKTKLTDK